MFKNFQQNWIVNQLFDVYRNSFVIFVIPTHFDISFHVRILMMNANTNNDVEYLNCTKTIQIPRNPFVRETNICIFCKKNHIFVEHILDDSSRVGFRIQCVIYF